MLQGSGIAAMPLQELDFHVRLTPAEQRVVWYLSEGLGDEDIAASCGSSVRAVRGTLHRFYEKTDLGYRRAAIWAYRHRECCLQIDPRKAVRM